MANAVININDVDNAFFDGLNSSREIRRALNDFIDDVAATWKMLSPERTGNYKAHIKTKKLSLNQRLFIKSGMRKGMHVGTVYNDSDISHFIEYGTGPDKPGSKSPFGPDTPTPEFAPARRAAAIMGRKFEIT